MQHIRGSLEKWRKDNPNAKLANISSRPDITDADFVYLEGIEELYIMYCKKITDAAFKHLKSVKILKMVGCDQEGITDKAFENLNNIQELEIDYCNQPGITDKAFKHFKRITTLKMQGCNQKTITDKAFRYLENIQTLYMGGCNQEEITDKAFTYLTGIRHLDISYCNQKTITGATLHKLITPESAAKYLETKNLRYLNLQVLTVYECNEETHINAKNVFDVGYREYGGDMIDFVGQYNPPVEDEEIWGGFTIDDDEKLNTIFEDYATAINYSVCPVCLQLMERSDACMYMTHVCDKNKVHTMLYKKYMNDEGRISWCTICNRIALGHRHYQMVKYDSAEKADLEPIQDGGPLGVFDTECQRQGGGGLDEKLFRFHSLHEYALKLEDKVGKISKRQAIKELVEEVWNAPFSGNESLLKKIREKGKFTHSGLKATNTEKNKIPKIPTFKDSGSKYPRLNEHGRNSIEEKDNVKVIEFRHRQRNNEIHKHGITPETLEGFIEGRVENRGDNDFGLCFMKPMCTAKLYPEELETLIEDGFPENLYEKYNEYFNNKFKIVQGGGNRENFFGDAHAMCVLPPKRHSTRRRRGGNRRNTRRKTPGRK